MPRLFASSFSVVIRAHLVKSVKVEVVGDVVHALHLLLTVQLEPFLDVYAQVLALLL